MQLSKNIRSLLYLLIFSLLLVVAGCDKSRKNVSTEGKLYLPDGCTYLQMLDSVRPFLKDLSSFENAAKSMKLKRIYPGRYTLKPGQTNEEVIKRLLLGKQDDIDITVGNYSSIFELAGKLDPILQASESDILQAIVQRPEAQGKDSLQMIYFLAPNTYRFHWTTKPADIVSKIAAPYQKFWTEENKTRLAKTGLSEFEAVTLASIVQLESYKPDEQPNVAGLYMNRLRIGMKLDADPTLIFIRKMNEGWVKKVNRVYDKNKLVASPYNTYQNAGLPPGPICMPNPSAIEAVLNPAVSEYIYFVADTARPGYHIYAKTLAEQNQNSKAYFEWANRNKVK